MDPESGQSADELAATARVTVASSSSRTSRFVLSVALLILFDDYKKKMKQNEKIKNIFLEQKSNIYNFEKIVLVG